MHSLRADLHVHTVLSPCAGVEMIPPLIVRQALAVALAQRLARIVDRVGRRRRGGHRGADADGQRGKPGPQGQ